MTQQLDSITLEMLQTLPELQSPLAAMQQEAPGEHPGPYVVFDLVLTPYLAEKLSSKDSTTLQRIFTFLEQLAAKADPEVDNLLALTVCNFLLEQQDRQSVAQTYMGPRFTAVLTSHSAH